MDNFVVSARKYRPATFASVVGQKHITSTLRNAIERGQLAHAYLFCGPRGVGKTTCARIFAKAINCLHPEGAEACNACESCRSFNENRSLNIHELDAASNNSVDDIRSLIEQVRIIPQSGRYAVFIIDEVHMLSAAAFNAFLKTLEEPPAHAIFILATTEKHKIIPTILSRCQIYDFNRIRVEDAVEYLKYIASQEGVEADDESLNLIAQKADGGMRDALSMFDKAVSFCGRELRYGQVAQTLNVLDYDTYFGLADTLRSGDYAAALLAFDRVLSKGFSGQTFMAGLNRHMRDLLMARDAATARLLEVTGTLMERYRTQASACDPAFLFGAISVLTELDGKIRQSSNQRLLVELGLMKIAGLGQKKNEPVTLFEARSLPLPDLTPRHRAAVADAGDASPEDTRPAGDAPQGAAPVADAGRALPPEGNSAVTPGPGEQNPSDRDAAIRPEAVSAPETPSACGSGKSEQTSPRPLRTPLVSLTELMNSSSQEESAVRDEEVPQEETSGEEGCAEQLEACREELLAAIRDQRPRFAAAFETMRFEGDTIRVEVPSQALCEEILRCRTELLTRIAQTACIRGTIRLEAVVTEQAQASRPYKLEDRLRYMNEQNPLVERLRRELDLEAE